MSVLPFDAQASVWADVKPIPQDDGPSPLCPILYSPNYSQAMDLLRALLPLDELSPRSLALTEHLVQLCPSNYTIWQFRARILVHGPEDDDEVNGLGKKQSRLGYELQFLDQLAQANMKSYQVWQHRKLIVTALGDPSRELSFVERVLDEDSKNYHTWVYRQWVLAHFGGLPGSKSDGAGAASFSALWKGELAFVDKLLSEDVRNNSAWNHRYYCLFASRWARACDQQDSAALTVCQQDWKVGSSFEEIVQNEIAYAKDHIKLVPNNASAWNYLRGVTKMTDTTNPFEQAVTDLARPLSQGDAPPPLALEWLLDDMQAKLKKSGGKHQEILPEAETLVQQLIEIDPIRRRYWQYRFSVIKQSSVQ